MCIQIGHNLNGFYNCCVRFESWWFATIIVYWTWIPKPESQRKSHKRRNKIIWRSSAQVESFLFFRFVPSIFSTLYKVRRLKTFLLWKQQQHRNSIDRSKHSQLFWGNLSDHELWHSAQELIEINLNWMLGDRIGHKWKLRTTVRFWFKKKFAVLRLQCRKN